MAQVPTNPYNLVATNIHSVYGGFGNRDTWKASAGRVLRTPSKKAGSAKGGFNHHTSCDETTQPDQLIQRHDDDKLELMCYQHWWEVMFFLFSSFGQARSPMQVELDDSWQEKQSDDVMNNSVAITVDGEAYFIRGGQHIKIETDPTLKHIKMQKRQTKFKDISKIFGELHHLAPPFV